MYMYYEGVYLQGYIGLCYAVRNGSVFILPMDEKSCKLHECTLITTHTHTHAHVHKHTLTNVYNM